MKVFLKGKSKVMYGIGEYNVETGELIVKKGSLVSENISTSDKFKGSKTVKKYRDEFTINYETTVDVHFNSPSTAANFITGTSSNGLRSWKTEAGICLKDYLESINKW